MKMTGQLKVNAGVSRLNGTRLAINGAPDPFGAATNSLANLGLGNNDFIWAEGNNGFVGNVPVFFITAAGALGVAATTATGAIAKVSAKKAAKKSTKKAVKKAGQKSGGKKGGQKKSGGGRTGAKRPAKRSAGKKSTKDRG
jgi:hypothetical protein